MAVEARMREIGKPLPGEVLTRVRRWFEEAVSTCMWAKGFNHAAAAGVAVSAPASAPATP